MKLYLQRGIKYITLCSGGVVGGVLSPTEDAVLGLTLSGTLKFIFCLRFFIFSRLSISLTEPGNNRKTLSSVSCVGKN